MNTPSSFIVIFFTRICKFYLTMVLIGCSPIYDETFCHEEEFIIDSLKIARSKTKACSLKATSSSTPLLSFCKKEKTVQEGDRFSLVVHCPTNPDFVAAVSQINIHSGFVVSQGQLSLPYISSIEIRGETLRELKERIQQSYHSYFPDMQVFLTFKESKNRFVFLIGAKKFAIPLTEEMTLSQVLAQAELPSFCNLHRSYLMRQGEKLPVNLFRLICEGDEKENLFMHEGDQIFLANEEAESVMILGEVKQPSLITVPNQGLSLREALTQAGGISFTGARNPIQVIRGNFFPPKIYLISWERMLSAPHESLRLMPGDIVTVFAKPLIQWNQSINALQPSLQALEVSHTLYKKKS